MAALGTIYLRNGGSVSLESIRKMRDSLKSAIDKTHDGTPVTRRNHWRNVELSENTIVSKGQNQVEAVTDEEIVLMHVDKGTFCSLDAIAQRIWQLIDEPQTIGAVCQQLTEEYDVPMNRCVDETIELIGKLVDRELVEIDTRATS